MPKEKTADEKIMDAVNAAHPINPKVPHDPAVLQKRRKMWQAEAGKHAKAYYEAKAKAKI